MLRTTILTLTLGLVAAISFGAQERKPDMVILLCDDFNPFYTGFAGDPDAWTPHLDQLAAESAVFTRCYSASAVCMSARASLVTGLYPHNTGCWGNADELFVPPRLTSMFSDLKTAGYTTAIIGKTHWVAGTEFKDRFSNMKGYFRAIGINHAREVATTFGSRNGTGPYQDFLRAIGKFEAQAKDLTDRLANNQYVARPSLLAPEESCDWMMADLALEHLAATPVSQPLAMMVGFSNPHSPFDPASQYATRYDPETLLLRENVVPFRKYGTDYTLAEVRKARAAYLGKISFLDDLLGRVVAALRERGTWDKTILVFTADHGLAVGEHGNIAKGEFWEEVARVPMVMRVPGLTDAGITSDALSQLIDLYPTLVELAGGEVSPHVRGRSLVPILRDPEAQVRDAAFCEIHHDGSLDYMVRTERHKWFVTKGRESLYDLDADPFEQNDLIRSAGHEAVAAEMRDRLRIFLMTEQINASSGYTPLAERVKMAEEKEQP